MLSRLLVLLACVSVIALVPPVPCGEMQQAKVPDRDREPASQSQAASEDRETQFKQLAAKLAEQRRSGGAETEEPQKQALELLDGFVLENLNGAGGPKLEGLNSKLATLVSRQPATGQNYQMFRFGAAPAIFALVANFGASGPSAVRVYSAGPQKYRLAGRIDRFAQPDFFDDYLELVPIDASAAVFVIIAGRADQLQTGSFSAWQFHENELRQLWLSDMLAQSSYEAQADGFLVSYCAETDEDQPLVCQRMVQDHYVWDGVEWRLADRNELPKRP